MLDHLTPRQQEQLLEDLNYLNLGEIRTFCKRHSIPYSIYVETESGDRQKTRDTDRKSVVLERVRHFLKTGEVLAATCFAAIVVCPGPAPTHFAAKDRLHYGWYDKTHPGMLKILSELTGGEFRNGAIARILAREFWTAGKAPTFKEFAKAWQKAQAQGLGHHPEAAWLTDRARGTQGPDWKRKRERIAQRTLHQLNSLR